MVSSTPDQKTQQASSTRTATGTKVDYQYSSNSYALCWIAQRAGMAGAPADINAVKIVWNGTQVYSKASSTTCAALGVAPGVQVTGTDGNKYTTGTAQSAAASSIGGSYYSIKQN